MTLKSVRLFKFRMGRPSKREIRKSSFLKMKYCKDGSMNPPAEVQAGTHAAEIPTCNYCIESDDPNVIASVYIDLMRHSGRGVDPSGIEYVGTGLVLNVRMDQKLAETMSGQYMKRGIPVDIRPIQRENQHADF